MKNYILILIAAASITVISCGDEHQYFPEKQMADGSSTKIKFIHAASDTVGLNLFLDGQKLTGNAPSTVSTGAVNMGTVKFDASFPVTDYVSVSGSEGKFSAIVPETYTAADTFPETILSELDASIDPSKKYTVVLVGVTSTYETILFEDDLSTTPLDDKAYIRFAGFIDNLADQLTLQGTPPATPEDPVPVPVKLAEHINFKDMSAFIALPRVGKYTSVQIVNETTAAVIYTLPGASSLNTFINNKVYTYYAKGRIGGTGAAAPGIGRAINR
ncbi:MAG: DUF4397 domain-containing protein [Chitinophagaceae bacterium]|nr:DUF4397 domain-containing protein [Chitinophagaceae bacterium]